jgi:hypothetical protein
MNKATVAAALAIILGCAACASSSGGAPAATPAPRAAAAAGTLLTWGPTAPTTATYRTNDSTKISVQAGPAGTVDINIALNGTALLSFQPNGDSTRITAQFTDFAGEVKNSMGPTVTVSKEDVLEPSILSIDRRGSVNIIQKAKASPKMSQVGSAETFFRSMLVRLPARAVMKGASWVDTVTATDAREGMSSKIISVVSSTYASDTTFAGRTVQVIRSTASNTLNIAGTAQGMELSQTLQGTSQLTTLFDAQRRIVVDRNETGEMKGTMDMPGMGMSGMPITATSKRHYVLVSAT